MDGRMVRYMIALCVAFVAVACSTTSRLGEGEVLYTGVKKLRVNVPDTVEVPGGVSDNIKSTINVKPNNSLYSPYVRHPFPLGLWLYNHWSEDEKGIKGWIYRKFVEQPVLISDVRPDLRVKMMEDMLAKNGFFGATSTYELLYDKRNPKKARVNYTVNLPDPDAVWRFGGYQRLSGFMPLQTTYSELFFSDKLWPDFQTEDMFALAARFAQIKRNFGEVSQ